MKKYLLVTASLFLVTFAWSQSNKDEVALMQAAFGMDKQSVVAEFVKPSPAEKDAFWKIYDEYEVKRKELGLQRIALLEEYADKYLTMNGVDADAWTKKVISLQKKTDDLIATYYSKVLKVSDGVVATQFYQIENFILTALRAEILQKVPFLPNKN
jgi:hypothetical protein